MEYDQDFYLGLATLLQKVIEEAEGIQMTACDDSNCHNYLLYPSSYPWQLNDVERSLTEEQLTEIFRRYIQILTNKPIDIDSQSAENGG